MSVHCLGQKIFNGILNECTLFGTKIFNRVLNKCALLRREKGSKWDEEAEGAKRKRGPMNPDQNE
jgi:hypothetical protein